MKTIFVLAVLLPFIVGSVETPHRVLQDLQAMKLTQLETRVTELENQFKNIKQYIITLLNDSIDNGKTQILTYIRKNGVNFGNRWIVREEGTGSYEALVFRDLTGSASKDSRYAMWPARYKDY